MKFTQSILLVACVGMVCACEKEMPINVESETKVETRATTEMLSFVSIEEMEDQICDLRSMQPEERDAWYAIRNFESQYDALYRAAAEIDNTKTLEEAKAIKAKYTSYFLYNENPVDEELFNPYLPNEKPDYAYVCNINGEVMIDGKIVNYNTIKDVKDTHEYQLAHAVETRTVETHQNYLKATVGKRKFWAEGRLDKNEVVAIEFTAHKKGWFGWNKYKTAYFVRVERYNRSWESFSPDMLYYLNEGKGGLWTKDLASHTLMPVGRLAFKQTATMDLYIYSRGTGVEGAGTLRLSYTSTRATQF